NWFDTAEIYGNGESEQALARALRALGKTSDDVIIATKWWPAFRTAKSILRTIDARIAALDNYRIDLHQIHQPFSFSSTRSQIREMAKLVEMGKIRYVGVSNFSAKRMRIAHEELAKHGLRLVSNQVNYSLLNRKIETNGVMDAAKELGISIIAYSPLAQGLLSGKFHDNPAIIKNLSYRKYLPAFKSKGLAKSRPVIDVLKELAKKYDATPSQVALNWVMNFKGDMMVAIPGATKISHAKENIDAMKFELAPEDLIRLDEITAVYKS
ncbi:MAG TPA: aldo/keto reductase, partial [bacterium]